MRIAVVNWNRRKVGGAEQYLDHVIPGLLHLGHQVALWHEIDKPSNRAAISTPEGVPAWDVSQMGIPAALAALEEWRPDLLYCHGPLEPQLEARLLQIGPGVFFAHGYHGICINGSRTNGFPTITPCERQFGWPCLLHYFPRRCGGLNPITMFQQYEQESQRLRVLSQYRAIVTHSEQAQAAYSKHGLDPDRVHWVPFVVYDENVSPQMENGLTQIGAALPIPPAAACSRLLFLGRMDKIKGGEILLKSLPMVRAALGRPLSLTFAGDGPDRENWERRARRIEASNPGIAIEFSGWVSKEQQKGLFSKADLLVMPSLWPEPFGMVGPEAGLHGVPVAAFSVGGIPVWLKHGVNGYLAPGDPPTVVGLAAAITHCLEDSAVYSRLREGASDLAQRLRMGPHLSALMPIFEKAVRG